MAKKLTDNRLRGRFWITSGGKNFAGQGRAELLRRIKETGSISAAAKQMGMSYKAAWDSVDAMNNLSEKPLVERVSGGRHGGGTALTEAGEDFLRLYAGYVEMFDKLLSFMEENPEVGGMIDRLGFQTTADNAFYGVISGVEKGAVSSIVEITASGGLKIVSSVTSESAEKLKLTPGTSACALINSNQLVLIDKNQGVAVSARNRFDGKVKVIKTGAVNSEILIELAGGEELKVMITNSSAEKLGICYGSEITALCKASGVIVVV